LTFASLLGFILSLNQVSSKSGEDHGLTGGIRGPGGQSVRRGRCGRKIILSEWVSWQLVLLSIFHQIKPTLTTIALIKRIHKENRLLSPERIHDQLINLGITNALAPNTIVKYLPSIRKPPSEKQQQSWKTFLANHRKGIWAMDFFVVPTLYFKILYVFLVISHDRRKIEHFAVTTNPTSALFTIAIIFLPPRPYKIFLLIQRSNLLYQIPFSLAKRNL
jgi:hypothetical protein